MTYDELLTLTTSADFQKQLDAIREQMSPEHQVGMAIRGVFASLDELIALANTAETKALVCKEKIALGQMLTRCQTMLSFALADEPRPFVLRRIL